MHARTLTVSCICIGLAVGATALPLQSTAATGSQSWTVASATEAGPGDNESHHPSISGDGGMVVFTSEAANLVPGDYPLPQVFARDGSGAVIMVSVGGSGLPDGSARTLDGLAVSDDGTKVLFESRASNLPGSPGGGEALLYVKDLPSGTVTLVGTDPSGTPVIDFSSPTLSADGSTVGFLAWDQSTDTYGILVRDLTTGVTTAVPGEVAENELWLSADGSRAAYLVADENDDNDQAWVKDLETGEEFLASATEDGEPAEGSSREPQLSADGTSVLFLSDAPNLPGGEVGERQAYIKDLTDGDVTLVSVDEDGNPADERVTEAAFSEDGEIVVLATEASLAPADSDGTEDIYAVDLDEDDVVLLERSDPAVPPPPFGTDVQDLVVSADGTTLAFSSQSELYPGANGASQIYLGEVTFNDPPQAQDGSVWGEMDAPAAVTLVAEDDDEDDELSFEVVSPPSHGVLGDCGTGSCTYTPEPGFIGPDSFTIRAYDGQAWSSTATMAVQVVEPGRLLMASISDNGFASDARSENPSLSADGRYVAFQSEARNLHTDVNDSATRVYVRDLTTGTLSVEATGQWPSLSADAHTLAFYSEDQLVPLDTDTLADVYVKDRTAGTYTLASVGATGKSNSAGVGTLEMHGIALSADATRVAFTSSATNLHTDDTDGLQDVFVKDLATGTLHLASSEASGTKLPGYNWLPSISAEGTLVVFANFDPATGQEGVHLKDLSTGALTTVAESATGWSGYPFVSADGSTVSFLSTATDLVLGDTDTSADVYLYDVATGQLSLGGTNAAGDKALFDHSQGRAVLSADGSMVAFRSFAANMHPDAVLGAGHIYVKNLQTGGVTVASVSGAGVRSNGSPADNVALSGDGDTVAFVDTATNLYPFQRLPHWSPTPDVFVSRLGPLDVGTDDADGDGVHDAVDDGDGAFRSGDTYGVIVDAAGQDVVVEPAAEPDRVRITVSGDGSGTAHVSACGMQLFLPAPSQVVIECGSLLIEVLEGPVEVVLGDGATVSVPDGVTAYLDEREDGGYVVEHRQGEGLITVTIDGVPQTVDPGGTHKSWHLTGFDPPVRPAPTVNAVKAGSNVPLKWQVLDADGAPVTTATAVTLWGIRLSCATGAPLADRVQLEAGTAKHQGGGRYHYNWKTPKSLAGSCVAVSVDVGPAEHTALFGFK